MQRLHTFQKDKWSVSDPPPMLASTPIAAPAPPLCNPPPLPHAGEHLQADVDASTQHSLPSPSGSLYPPPPPSPGFPHPRPPYRVERLRAELDASLSRRLSDSELQQCVDRIQGRVPGGRLLIRRPARRLLGVPPTWSRRPQGCLDPAEHVTRCGGSVGGAEVCGRGGEVLRSFVEGVVVAACCL